VLDELGILDLIQRIGLYAETEPYQLAVELFVIWLVVFLVLRFLRGTRGARAIKGLAVLLLVAGVVIQLLGRENQFERLQLLYSNFLALVSLVLIVVFQPELRRALVRLGEARLFKQGGLRRERVVRELLESTRYLSRNKIGALVAIERQVGLRGIVEVGTPVDAEISKQLLNTIFWPGSALHDMGVVIRGDRVVAAGVQFPLAEGDDIPQELGSRHRAAIGLSQETDALILVVSEETGTISVAERGKLRRNLSVDDLRPILMSSINKLDLTEIVPLPDSISPGGRGPAMGQDE